MSLKVVIADDAAFMRMNLKNILEEGGLEVVGEAKDGQEAINLYQELNPDLLTLDITMPEMDGLTALEKIMQLDPNARVIVVSAMGQETYIRKAIMAGAKHFIVKPFKKDRIMDIIKKVV